MAKTTGIEERRVVKSACTSDLCEAAAERLLAQTGIDRASIDLLLFVTQTPDQLLPATACGLQGRLSLPTTCAALDINLGCSGYTYGLWLAANMLGKVVGRRALLLVGDTISRIVSPDDMSTAPLFGDAGAATLLVSDPEAPDLVFALGTDSSGGEHLCVPAGGFRRPSTSETRERIEHEDGSVRSYEDLYMDGAEVFSFALKRVPPMISELLGLASWRVEDIDAFIPHQANAFMLRHLSKKMKLSPDQLILALEGFGNTSSASIPLAITTKLRPRMMKEPMNVVLAGFGVGWSWGAIGGRIGPLAMPELCEVDE